MKKRIFSISKIVCALLFITISIAAYSQSSVEDESKSDATQSGHAEVSIAKTECLTTPNSKTMLLLLQELSEQVKRNKQMNEQISNLQAENRWVKDELQLIKAKLMQIDDLRSLMITCCQSVSADEQNTYSKLDKPFSGQQDIISATPSNRKSYLKQNVPNPFHKNTVIPYFLSNNVDRAQIKLFDASSGERIRQIELGTSSGNGMINFDAEGIPSGTYVYVLYINNSSTSVKKMIIIH